MLPGVYTNKKKDGTLYYRSSITFQGRHISLGSYSSEADAAKSYQLADSLLHDPSISLSDYKKESILPFPKWVILSNFRDNGIYVRTPVYLYRRFFYYYFNCDDFLIFDIDDLFYYSTRTITRRGGHLFVADYGMQVNILSRYGIKNHAVIGRDYRFINGNKTDFRYDNIEIINRYYGVSKKEKKGKICYETRININGSRIVGRYKSETEAAVAYNKAVTILLKKGYHKNYPVNYIEELTKKEYRDLFQNVTVSPRICDLTPLP